MVGMAKRLASNPTKKPDSKAVAVAYQTLLKDAQYVEAVSRSTADPAFVIRRIEKAVKAFADC
jgi:hypothetical protein